jgi:GMP synthase-like glutamine amidotransferase
MNIHYLQHVPFEGLGNIEQWAIANGHHLSVTRLYAGDHLPALEHFDMLILLGGPMSVHDELDHVWLKAEKWFLRQVIDAGKPVLGICLGAQLIAEVLGGTVTAGAAKEIGWFPITLKDEFADSDFGQRLPRQSEVFHWHGETFSIPVGAMPIASSEACENQGFIFNDSVVALQCHLETTHISAASIIDNSRAELVGGKYIQSEEEMLGKALRFAKLTPLMAVILEYLAERAGTR